MTSWNAGITPALDKLYSYLIEYQAQHGELPSQKQIAFDLNKHDTTIHSQMRDLAELGKVEISYKRVHYSLKE